MPKPKRKNVVEVDEHGDIIEYYLMNDEEIKNARNEGRYIITKTFEGLYQPKYDFEQEKWIEGATQEEIDNIKNQQPEPNEIERIKQHLTNTENALLSIMDTMIEKGGIS